MFFPSSCISFTVFLPLSHTNLNPLANRAFANSVFYMPLQGITITEQNWVHNPRFHTTLSSYALKTMCLDQQRQTLLCFAYPGQNKTKKAFKIIPLLRDLNQKIHDGKLLRGFGFGLASNMIVIPG